MKLNFQSSAKTYWQEEINDNSISVEELYKQLKPINKFTPQSKEYIIYYNDKEIVDRSLTLKELSVEDGGHFNLVNSEIYNSPKKINLNIKVDDTNQITIENVIIFHTIRSLLGLIANRLSLDPGKLSLIYSAKVLDINRTISNSALYNGTTLILIKRS